MPTIKIITVGTLKEDYLRDAVAEYEKRKLNEQINSQFYMNLGISESIRKECEFLEDLLRPYEKLAHKYRCSDAEELEKLIMDLHDKLFEKKEK